MRFTVHRTHRHPRTMTAAAALAGSVAFLLSASALAAQWQPGVAISGDALAAASSAAEATRGAAATAGLSANCGKCHSPCEDGASHARHALPASRGAELPAGSEGLIGCVTCHEPHREGVQTSTESRLRISNLRRELCLACHGGADEEGPVVQIVSPLEQAIVLEERVALIGRAVRPRQTRLTVRLNGSAFDLPVKDGRFFTWLRLQEGVNRVQVALEGRTVWTGELFHGGNVTDRYGRTFFGHGTATREECLGCHLASGGVSAGTASEGPALCYGCHDRHDGKRYVHGPLAVGDCLVCHDPHGGLGSAHLRNEQGLLCRSCHPARDNAAKVACDSSGKACVACHDPHQSNARYLLKGPQYTMLDARAETR